MLEVSGSILSWAEIFSASKIYASLAVIQQQQQYVLVQCTILQIDINGRGPVRRVIPCAGLRSQQVMINCSYEKDGHVLILCVLVLSTCQACNTRIQKKLWECPYQLFFNLLSKLFTTFSGRSFHMSRNLSQLIKYG